MNEQRRRRSEADMAGDCDVLVTKWRFSRAYVLVSFSFVIYLQCSNLFVQLKLSETLRGYSTSNLRVYYRAPWINSCIILYPRGRSRLFITTYVHLFHSFFSARGLSHYMYPFFLRPSFAHRVLVFDYHPFLSFWPPSRYWIPFSIGVWIFWTNLELIRVLFSFSPDFFKKESRSRYDFHEGLFVIFFLRFGPSLYFSHAHSNPPSTRR